MADIVQEQMGDILSAFGIPDLAKHIIPIPLPPLDEDDEQEEEEPKNDKAKENETKEDRTEGETSEEKDASDSAMEVDKPGEDGGDQEEEETTLSAGGEETKDAGAVGNLEEDAVMETDEGTDSSTIISQNEDEAALTQDRQAETFSDRPDNSIPDLGLKQSVASLNEDGSGNQEASLIKQLLKSTSKPVMTSRLQDDLPNSKTSLAVPEEPNLEEIPVESLNSFDEFNSFLDRCKESRELLELKMAIFGKASCIPTYECPSLTDEQRKVLDMDKEVFQCPGCKDKYLFKASLDAHLDRKTVLVTFRCKWCSGRQHLVFYNKCTFLAHLHNHKMTEKQIENVKLEASITPVNALDSLRIYTRLTAQVKTVDNSKPSVQKPSTPSSIPRYTSSTPPPPKIQSLVNQQATLKSTPPSVNKSNNQGNKQPVVTMFPKSKDGEVKQNSYECIGCKRRYDRMNHLRAHLDRPHPAPSTPGYKGPLHQCSICKLVVANKCKLIMHNIIHTSDGKTPLPCPECGCMQSDLRTLLIHQNDGCLHWMTKPLFKCTFCNKYATTFPGLIKHFEQNHVDVFYKCPLCQLAFRNKQSASEHTMEVHKLKSMTYGLLRKCPFCKSVYSERSMLATHFESHYQNGLIKIEKFVFCCSLCSKPFDYGQSLRYHLYEEHGRSKDNTFFCDLCQCAFTTIDHVMQHRPTCVMSPTRDLTVKPNQPEEKSTVQQPGKVYVCGECGEKIPQFNMDALQKHMFERHSQLMKESLAGTKKPEGSSSISVKNQVASIKPKAMSEPVKPPAVTRKEVPVKVERFTDLQCGKCQFKGTDRLVFEKHILGHKTEESFCQCHECGLCFTVEGSLKKHLFIKHKIKNMNTYYALYEELMPKWEEEMKKKKLEEKEKEKESLKAQMKEDGDEKAKMTEKDDKIEEKEEETSLFKCKVCKVEFENDKALTVHARSHGLAYLQHTLTRSPDKAARMQTSKLVASPNKEPEIKPSVPTLKRSIPLDTDSSTSSDETSSMEDTNGD